MGYIYKITNKINFKCYIGKTQTEPDVRWKQHLKYFNKKIRYVKPLYLAMQKYGIENFNFEILEQIEDNLLSEREIYFIQFFQSYGEKGYNATLGGDGTRRVKWDADKIVKTYLLLKHVTNTAKELNISRITVRKILQEKKIDTLKNQKSNAPKKPIVQYDLRGDFIREWSSMTEAVKTLNLNKKASTHIGKCCRGEKKKAYGFLWKYK